MPELRPIAWFCTKDADGKPLLEKCWSTNPRYVEVHSRCDWTPVYIIPADQVLVPRELLERIDTALTRHLAQHGPMRVPPDPTDSDLVREEVRAILHS